MNLAKDYANELANSLTKITLTEFYQTVHDKFYPAHDISFRDYFLELTNHEGEFVVHHDKLVDYGIMTSKQSNAVKSKLETLMLIKGEDFTLQDVLERGKSGSQIHKHYLLTPEAFKKCLMRAQRRPKQKVDPVIYINYYLLLEKIHKLYTDYERMYSEKLLSMKDDKIDQLLTSNKNLENKLDDQSNQIKTQSNLLEKQSDQIKTQCNQIETQSDQIKQLLGYAKDTKEELKGAREDIKDLNESIDTLHDTVIDMHEINLNAGETAAALPGSPSKRTQYAMTVSVRSDKPNTFLFHHHRIQACKMSKKLVDLMTKPTTDKDGAIIESAHSLIIPPIDVSGATNIPHAGNTLLQSYLKNNVLHKLNEGKSKDKKISYTNFIKQNGIVISTVHPVIKKNKHISFGRFVHFFVSVIKSVRFGSFRFVPPTEELQKVISNRLREHQVSFVNATGESRERIYELVKLAENAQNNLKDENFDPDNDEYKSDCDPSLYDDLIAVDDR